MKAIKAVKPYEYKGVCNFKSYPYYEWEKQGLPVAQSHYPHRIFHKLAYNLEISTFIKSKKQARLRFVSGYSINFDTFPDYAFYEIIPIIWDCWPKQVPNVKNFFQRHNVETAIFTSSQTADIFRHAFPHMNILTITEGVNVSLYSKGKELKDRNIDVLEVGRGWVNFFKTPLPQNINHIKTGNFTRAFKTDEDFRIALSNTKVTINVPRCDVDKETAGNIETLTQRYWECMLSRVVMIGRAPKELINLIGYDPVVEFEQYNSYDTLNVEDFDVSVQVTKILDNIDSYQQLVDKNYEIAKKMAPWTIRIKQIADYLKEKDYQI